MANFYVTYGCGSNQTNCYSVVEADNYGDARQKVFDAIGPKFAFMYMESEFEGQASKYGLKEIPLAAQIFGWPGSFEASGREERCHTNTK